MPRVAQAPRSRKAAAEPQAPATPFKSPVKCVAAPRSQSTALTDNSRIPLNDDAQEKAKRLQNRHALHDMQINQLKAAASPAANRRVSSLNSNHASSPKTPRQRGKENGPHAIDEDDIQVSGSAVTPLHKSNGSRNPPPLLANFEEWMKMATDNKINSTNSWNFALIDYFHDMRLLKTQEGGKEGVDFMKASCTLDGCVKIYTSRVDGLGIETGRLLSGLSESKQSKSEGGNENGEGGEGEDDEEEVDEDGNVKKRKKKARSSEATLASSFSQLQLKKMELEFAVDPLFKKASADFDEGGAKGLLLNHLSIDAQGRIVFDSSDDANDASSSGPKETDADAEQVDESTVNATKIVEEDDEDVEIDIGALGSKFFPNLAILDTQDVCPTLKDFDLGDLAGTLDIPFLKAPEEPEHHDVSGMNMNDGPGFDDDDGFGGGFEGEHTVEVPVGFGEGGEAWAREAAIEPQMGVMNIDEGAPLDGEDGEVGTFDPESGEFIISLENKRGATPMAGSGGHEDILAYFDTALQKNWAGPEHWRIRKIKDSSSTAAAPKARKEKEPFEIDFLKPLDAKIADMIYTPASSSSAIQMPKKEWKSKSKNLLPDDKHFSSRQLLRLFLKPKASIGSRKPKSAFGFGGQTEKKEDLPAGEMDEAFWAQKEAPILDSNEEDVKGDYDANFFQDDGGMGGMEDDDDFADAREELPGSQEPPSSQPEGAFGTQLVTQSRRLRPEYVQYARVAKKVDVRRLKEELWRGLGRSGLHSVSFSLIGWLSCAR